MLDPHAQHASRNRTHYDMTAVVVGKTGTGKSSTINHIVGQPVSPVGLYGRGTSRPMTFHESYCDQCQTGRPGSRLRWIDLPGLGESKTADAHYQRAYRRWGKQGDAFLIVTVPPRPAEWGTLSSLRFLLRAGVSSQQIIFGINRAALTMYDDGSQVRPIEFDATVGPVREIDRHAVTAMRRALLRDIKLEFSSQKDFGDLHFDLRQVVAYDCNTGWNVDLLKRTLVQIGRTTI